MFNPDALTQIRYQLNPHASKQKISKGKADKKNGVIFSLMRHKKCFFLLCSHEAERPPGYRPSRRRSSAEQSCDRFRYQLCLLVLNYPAQCRVQSLARCTE